MWMKIATAGAVGAIIVGAGVAALASSGSSESPPPRPGPAAPSADALLTDAGSDAAVGLGRRGRFALRHFEHGEWVARNGSSDVTHDAIKGKVSSVSATSISVTATDGFSQTYAVKSDTKVVLRENGRGSAHHASIGEVKSGDLVLVAGVKSGSTLGAKHVVDVGH